MAKVKLGFTMQQAVGQTHYQVLGVLVTATHKQLRDAYYALAIKHHPDHGGSADKFKQVTLAYSVLRNPVLRRDYDARLRLLGRSAQQRCSVCKGKRRVEVRKGLRAMSVQCPHCKGTGNEKEEVC